MDTKIRLKGLIWGQSFQLVVSKVNIKTEKMFHTVLIFFSLIQLGQN